MTKDNKDTGNYYIDPLKGDMAIKTGQANKGIFAEIGVGALIGLGVFIGKLLFDNKANSIVINTENRRDESDIRNHNRHGYQIRKRNHARSR